MGDGSQPAPPSHLSAKSRGLWRSILDRYDLEDQELATLTLALESFDTAQTARRLLRREGVVVRDRFDQPKPHPAAAVCRDAMSTWSRLMRDLGLPADEGDAEAQPRGRRGHFEERTPRGRGRVARAKAAEHG
jgi:P27 family predicted phage terminase small subunit